MKIKDLFKGLFPHQAPRRTKHWAITLNELGFDKINFPIIIRGGNDLEIVYRLEDFAIDPDYFFHEYDSRMDLIDSNGNLWTWKYDSINKTNLPGILKQTLSVDDVKGIISNYFKNSKAETKMKEFIEKGTTVRGLIEDFADRL